MVDVLLILGIVGIFVGGLLLFIWIAIKGANELKNKKGKGKMTTEQKQMDRFKRAN